MTDHAYQMRQARLGRKPINEALKTTLYIIAFMVVYAFVSDVDYREEVAKEVAAKQLFRSYK